MKYTIKDFAEGKKITEAKYFCLIVQKYPLTSQPFYELLIGLFCTQTFRYLSINVFPYSPPTANNHL